MVDEIVQRYKLFSKKQVKRTKKCLFDVILLLHLAKLADETAIEEGGDEALRLIDIQYNFFLCLRSQFAISNYYINFQLT